MIHSRLLRMSELTISTRIDRRIWLNAFWAVSFFFGRWADDALICCREGGVRIYGWFYISFVTICSYSSDLFFFTDVFCYNSTCCSFSIRRRNSQLLPWLVQFSLPIYTSCFFSIKGEYYSLIQNVIYLTIYTLLTRGGERQADILTIINFFF